MPDNAYVHGSLAATGIGTSSIAFNSGTLKAVRANIENGSVFTIGDGGANTATYEMKKTATNQNGTHLFSNNLVLNSNAVLNGNGDIVGNVAVVRAHK